MSPKRIVYLLKILLLILIFLVLLPSLEMLAKDDILPRPSVESNPRQPKKIAIRIYTRTIINDNFYGFGAETLPWLWTKENREAGINQEDIRLNSKRIKDMHLPITRIFVPWETWNPSVDYKTFTWESDEMRSLYRTLDIYQRMATKVILVTVDWLRDSPWMNVQASAQAVLELLEYLIKDKGYSCIEFWTLTNEPELTYAWMKKVPFENYVRIHQLVKKGLKKRRLAVKLIVSDDVESQEWFKKSVRYLYGVADIFSFHAYFYPQKIHLIPGYFRERLSIIKRASLAKRDIPFFLCEFGFRGFDFGTCTNSLMQDYEYGLYVADLCVEVLNSGIDAALLWCLHQIRLIDEVYPEGGKMMRIGLWAYKDEDWRPFPVFYLYRLFTRYIRANSKVLKTKIVPANILKAACIEYKGNHSLIIINMTDKNQNFSIKGIELGLDFKEYLYNRSKFPSTQENLLRAESQIETEGYLDSEIPPKSVVLYTNIVKEY